MKAVLKPLGIPNLAQIKEEGEGEEGAGRVLRLPFAQVDEERLILGFVFLKSGSVRGACKTQLRSAESIP